jgi:Fe-S-cluster-containing hydrogenase component 2
VAGKLALVDYRKCDPRRCEEGVCTAALACTRKQLRQEAPFDAPMAGTSPCRGCSDCALACPLGAIVMVTG